MQGPSLLGRVESWVAVGPAVAMFLDGRIPRTATVLLLLSWMSVGGKVAVGGRGGVDESSRSTPWAHPPWRNPRAFCFHRGFLVEGLQVVPARGPAGSARFQISRTFGQGVGVPCASMASGTQRRIASVLQPLARLIGAARAGLCGPFKYIKPFPTSA